MLAASALTMPERSRMLRMPGRRGAAHACRAAGARPTAARYSSTSARSTSSALMSTATISPTRLLAHDVGRQVVHDRAVDEDLAAMEHRRQDAGNRARRAQPQPQRTGTVHVRAADGEVGRDAVVRQRKILDVARAEGLAQQMRDAAPGDQRNKWKCVISQRAAVDERACGIFRASPRPTSRRRRRRR